MMELSYRMDAPRLFVLGTSLVICVIIVQVIPSSIACIVLNSLGLVLSLWGLFFSSKLAKNIGNRSNLILVFTGIFIWIIGFLILSFANFVLNDDDLAHNSKFLILSWISLGLQSVGGGLLIFAGHLIRVPPMHPSFGTLAKHMVIGSLHGYFLITLLGYLLFVSLIRVVDISYHYQVARLIVTCIVALIMMAGLIFGIRKYNTGGENNEKY